MSTTLHIGAKNAALAQPGGNGKPHDPDHAEPIVPFWSILSKSQRMHAIFVLINKVAQADTTVLIEGETGTGKEMVARAVHSAASHRSGPFVAVNCAAMPETLLESELFGHEKGAFTNAISQRKGRFELAHGGTIFLDEIGDVPPAMQVKLLRVLQERTFERLGAIEPIHVDVRIVAATNRPLGQLVASGKFREDLYYRLNVVKVALPPLRERREDIPLLARHFALKYAPCGTPGKGFDAATMEALVRHAWPGNVRELENAIERACVVSRGPSILVADLSADLLRPPSVESPFKIDLTRPLADHIREATALIERDYLCKALEETRGHVTECARISGLCRRSIAAKMAEHHLDKRSFKQAV